MFWLYHIRVFLIQCLMDHEKLNRKHIWPVSHCSWRCTQWLCTTCSHTWVVSWWELWLVVRYLKLSSTPQTTIDFEQIILMNILFEQSEVANCPSYKCQICQYTWGHRSYNTDDQHLWKYSQPAVSIPLSISEHLKFI